MTGRGVYEDDETVAHAQVVALMAAAPMVQVPEVSDSASLRVAIRYADRHLEARIFTIKSAAALGLTHLLPGWPQVTETVVNVQRVTARITASGALVAAATGRPLVSPAAPMPPGEPRGLTDGERQALRERVHGKPRGGRR